MNDSAAAYQARLLDWLTGAVDEGWIPGEEIATLERLEARGAEALFEPADGRPLTVGFFGGTGVGKSSLLNRLAGETVAAVGLERPTSTEVTVYVHEQYPLADLEDLLPVSRVRVQTHRSDAYRNVAWIDMPDIDSVERANRELVFEWLAYIDWLVYVVSPERYRDDAGWRVLAGRGYRHHWLFVMNRLDTGTSEQHRDFQRLLCEQGFDESRVLATSCKAGTGDDFHRMVGVIDRALAEHGLEALQQVGERARLLDLQEHCGRYLRMLGEPPRWSGFIERARAAMRDRLSALVGYLRDEVDLEVARLPDHLSGGDTPPVPSLPALLPRYVEDVESGIVVSVEGLPAQPIRHGTQAALTSLADRVKSALRGAFREGAARPGNGFQRGLQSSMRKLVYGLPLAAGIGVAYVVVARYVGGLNGTDRFLGLDFLIHSAMILGLSALVPYLAGRLLRPSVRRSIAKRAQTRLDALASAVTREWEVAMEGVVARSRDLATSLEAIRSDVKASMNRGS